MNDLKTLKNDELSVPSDLLACEFYTRGLYQQSIDQNFITLSLIGRNPSVLKNIANAYYNLCMVDKSLEYFKEYMDMTKSKDKIDIRQYAQYLTRSGKIEEAYKFILDQQIECYEKHLDIGWFLHREGKFKEAFIETEIGRGDAIWINKKRPPLCERWRSQNIKGKKLCVIGEAGLGDEMIFCRWIKDLKELGANVYYYTDNSLREVITRNYTIPPYDENLKYDFWVPTMSLPFLLQKEEAGNDVYLSANPLYIAKWKQKLENYTDIIVLNWTGDQNHIENKFREIPIEYLIPKIKDQGTLVSVCLDAKYCPEGVIDLTKDIKTWDDTLAILSLSKMCYTISSSVSVASGALGIKTHLYDLVVGYFTWNSAENGGLSSWFPDVTVWRQEKFGDWKSVIDRSLC